jgi:MoaA/NifB/PqqE/SkfB family radical SAM enzyme
MKPNDLNIFQTSKCNSNCRHCSRQKSKPTAKDVTPELLEDVLDRFPTITSVCMAGLGEPFVSPFLFDNLRLLNERGVKPGLITNGFLLGPYMDKLLETDLVYLSVSLNTSSRKEHEAITGTKTFNQVVASIGELAAEKRFPVGVSKVCFGQTTHKDMYSLLRYAHDVGLDFVHFVNNLPYDLDSADGVLTEEKDHIYKSRIEWLKEDTVKWGLKVKWPVLIPNDKKCACDSPWRSLGVNGDGLITGCRRVFPPSKEFGHYADEDVWMKSRGLIDLRSAVMGYTNKYSHFCNKCFGNYKGQSKC